MAALFCFKYMFVFELMVRAGETRFSERAPISPLAIVQVRMLPGA